MGVGGGVFDGSFGDVAGEGFLDIADAVGNVFGVSLCKHFDGSSR